jgi:small-conductance mechanosensitive channel
MRFAILLQAGLVALFLATAGTAAAQDVVPLAAPSSIASATPSPTPSTEIDTAPDLLADARIAARARAIYSEIPALRPVQVRVVAGVVTLTGKLADAKAIAQAEAIATRLAGVATVQNKLERDLSVARNLDPVSGAGRALLRVAPLAGIALAVAVLMGMLGYLLARQKALWKRIAPNPFMAELIATSIRVVFVIAGIVLGLHLVGATALLGAVLGGAGVLGIAIGFAVRDTIDNYISSLMLSIRQPFRANDQVMIDDHEGRVVRLTSRATVLMTPDGNHLRIPNSTVFKAVILNFTTNPKRRFTFDFTIDHAADPCHARACGLEAIEALDFVLAEPEPRAEIAEMPGMNQILRFSGWVDQTHTDHKRARTRAYEAVRAALRDAGFILPDATYRVVMSEPPPPVEPSRPRREPEAARSNDITPEREVAHMVDRERADDDGQDLLDSKQPVE